MDTENANKRIVISDEEMKQYKELVNAVPPLYFTRTVLCNRSNLT